MLSSLRPPQHTSAHHGVPPRFASVSGVHGRMPADPSELPPDRLHVEMEMSPDSQIILYGPLLRALISIKVRTTIDMENVCPGSHPDVIQPKNNKFSLFSRENVSSVKTYFR